MGQNNSSPENSSQDAPPPPAQTRTPPPPRQLRDVYAEAIRSDDGPRLSGEIQRLMRDQITGFVEDPRDPQANCFRRHLTLHQNPPLLISRATTLGELSRMGARLSMNYVTYTPSPLFLASEAAQVTIDELGDFDGPDGLKRRLDEGCASDEEKERMRTFVQNALVVLHDQEHDELHALVLEASREASAAAMARIQETLNRDDPFGEERRAAATRAAKKLTADQLRIKLVELGQPFDGTKPVLVARYVARTTRHLPPPRPGPPAAGPPSAAKPRARSAKPAAKKPSRAKKPRAKKPARRRRRDSDDLADWLFSDE
jgi:hypothetical protein